MGQRKLVEVCHSLQLVDFSGPSGSNLLMREGWIGRGKFFHVTSPTFPTLSREVRKIIASKSGRGLEKNLSNEKKKFPGCLG